MEVRNCLEDLLTELFTEFHHPILVTGWAEMTALTGKYFLVEVLSDKDLSSASALMGHGHHGEVPPRPTTVLVIIVSVIVRPIPEGCMCGLYV